MFCSISGHPESLACLRVLLSTIVPLTSTLAFHLVLSSLAGRGHEGREHSQSLNCLGLPGLFQPSVLPLVVVSLIVRAQYEGGEGVSSLGEEYFKTTRAVNTVIQGRNSCVIFKVHQRSQCG